MQFENLEFGDMTLVLFLFDNYKDQEFTALKVSKSCKELSNIMTCRHALLAAYRKGILIRESKRIPCQGKNIIKYFYKLEEELCQSLMNGTAKLKTEALLPHN